MEKIKAIKPAHKIGAGIITATLVAGVVLPSWNQSIPIQAEGETPNTTVDLSTANNYNAMLGDPDQGGRYAGRVWADKSVFNKPFPSNLGNEKTATYSVDSNKNESFLVEFSTLGSSRVVNSNIPIPLDVMFVLDISGSMNTGTGQNQNRISQTVEATNKAIEYLMGENEYNRIGVTVFSDADGVNTYLPLDRYSKVDNQDYIRLSSRGTSTSGNNTSKFSIDAISSKGKVIKKEDIAVVGGTNTQLGLYEGMSQLVSAENTTVEIQGQDIQRIPAVIFLSDGNPTFSSSGNWWSPDKSQQGPGGSSYYGNGMLALMTASSMKKRIAEHYGVTGLSESEQSKYMPKVYSVGMIGGLEGENLDLANVTLNPSAHLSETNTMATNVRDAWEIYNRSTNQELNQLTTGNYGSSRQGFRIRVDRNNDINYYQLRHPTGANAVYDLTGTAQEALAYNDGYFAADQDVTSAFQNIIESLTNTAFVPVTESIGSNPEGGIMYTDPIGECMEVKEIKAVTLFGEKLVVTKNEDGTYSVENKSMTHPVYKTSFNTGDIRIHVEKDKAGNETLTAHIPSGALPIRNETITPGTDGTLSYGTNNGTSGAIPLRIIYSVGIQDEFLANGTIDLNKLNAKKPDYVLNNSSENGLHFYSNAFNKGLESGSATVTYSPNQANRYYYFQTNRVIYENGVEGIIEEGGSVANPATSIEDDEEYFVVVDYYRPKNGKAELVDLVVKRPGKELLERHSVTAIAPLEANQYYGKAEEHAQYQPGDVWATKVGGVRMAQTYLFDGTKTDNRTGTASHYFKQEYNTDNSGFTIYLGNNGRLAVPNQSLLIGKDVAMPQGMSAPDDTFKFTVQLSGTENLPATGAVWTFNGKDWEPKLKEDGTVETRSLTFDSDGKTTLSLKKSEAILLSGLASETQYTVTENPKADAPYQLTQINGVDTTDPTSTGTISSENGDGNQVIFTNTYVPAAVTTSLRVRKALTGRAYQDDDTYTFTLVPAADNPASVTVSDFTISLTPNGAAGTVESSKPQTLSFEKPGTYSFTLRENVPQDGQAVPGVTYAQNTYDIQIIVGVDENDPTKLTTPIVQYRPTGTDPWLEYEADGESLLFENTYSNDGIGRSIWLTKVLENATLQNDQFEFELTKAGSIALNSDQAKAMKDAIDETTDKKNLVQIVEEIGGWATDPDQPDPSDRALKKTNTNAEKDNVVFGTFDFRSGTAGTNPENGKVYKYTIKENKPAQTNGITYDQKTISRYMYVYVENDAATGQRQIRAIPFGDRAEADTTFTNIYRANGQISVTGVKNLTGRPLNASDLFTFNIASPAGAPAILDANGKLITTVTIQPKADETGTNQMKFDIGHIAFDQSQAGTYTYTFTEQVPDQTKGITYDSAPKTMTVEIVDQGDGTMAARVNGQAADTLGLEWTNRYRASSAQVTLNGTKNLRNQAFGAGEFTFNIQTEDGTPLSLVGVGASQTTPDADGNYTGSFSILNEQTYTAPGTYTYRVTETSNTKPNVQFDSSVYRVRVIVTDNGEGSLVASDPIIEKANGDTWERVEAVAFNNTYDGPSYTPKLTKSMLGGTARAGYEFILSGFNTETNDETGLVLPENKSATSNEDGNVEFDAVHFLQEGTYRLEAIEKQPTKNGLYDGEPLEGAFKSNNGRWVYQGVSYDHHKATRTIRVSRVSGQLVASVVNEGTPSTFMNSQALSITKRVTNGNDVPASALNTPFTFEITLRRANENGETVPVTGERVLLIGNEQTTLAFDAEGKARFTLKQGQTAQLYGFLSKTQVTIEEVDVPEPFIAANPGPVQLEVEANTAIEPVVITNTYSAPNDVSIQVEKHLDGRDFRQGDAFEFTLAPEGDAPMPAISRLTLTPFEGRVANGSFGNILFTSKHAGHTYTYTMRETKGSLEGIVYDETIHKIVVDVQLVDGKVVTETTLDGAPVEAVNATFTNTYESSLTWSPTLTKTVTGGALESFGFTLHAEEQDGLSGTLDQTTTSSAEGLIVFDPVTFTKAGTYHFTVREQIPDGALDVQGSAYANGMLYDPRPVELDVEVTRRPDGSYYIVNESALNGLTMQNDAGLTITKDLYASDGSELTVEDVNQKFTFQFLASEKTYPYVKTTQDGTLQTGTIRTNDSFSLKTAEKMEIFGLSAGEAYTVRETGLSDPYTLLSEEGASGTMALNTSAIARFKNVKVVPNPVVLQGQKTMTGRDLQAGEFTFVIEGLSAETTGSRIQKEEETPEEEETTVPAPQPEETPALEADEEIESSETGENKELEADETQPEVARLSFLDRIFTRIHAEDNEIPMPESTAVTNDAAGRFVFGEILYTQPGVYRYRMYEQAGTDEEVAYDTKAFIATVRVVSVDNEEGDHVGIQVDSIQYTEESTGTIVEMPIFANTYERIPGTPHLRIEKSQSLDGANFTKDPIKVEDDDVVTYRLTVTPVPDAVKPEAATNVIVSDPVPEGLRVVESEISNGGTLQDGVITWNLGRVEPDASPITLIFRAQVPEITKETQPWKNTAFVRYDDEEDPSNTVVLEPEVKEPKIIIHKTQSVNGGEFTDTPQKVEANDKVTYRVEVANIGEGEAKQVKITDSVHPDLKVDSKSITEGGKIKDNTIEWNFETFSSGQKKILQFDVVVPPVQKDTQWTNIASLTIEDEPQEPSNEVEIEEGVPDLELAKAQSLNEGTNQPAILAQEGDVVTYTLTLKNNGTAASRNAGVTDVIPEGLELIENSISAGGVRKGNQITWTFDVVEPGAQKAKTMTFQVRIPGVKAYTSWKNIASAYDETHPDPEPSNEVEIESDVPKLEIYKRQAIEGGEPTMETIVLENQDKISYFVTVKNTGTVDAKNVHVSDSVPEGLEVIANSLSDQGTQTGQVVAWTIPALKVGQEKTFRFDAKVPNEEGQWVNAARARFENDPKSEDYESNEVVIVRAKEWKPLILIEKLQSLHGQTPTKTQQNGQANDIVTYTIRLRNLGSASAKSLVLRDAIPEGVTVIEKSISHGGTYKNNQIVWTFEELKPNETIDVSFQVKLPKVFATTVWKNTAIVDFEDENGTPGGGNPSNTVVITQQPPVSVSSQNGKPSSANTAVSTRSRLWMSTAGMALSSLGVQYVFKKRKKGK